MLNNILSKLNFFKNKPKIIVIVKNNNEKKLIKKLVFQITLKSFDKEISFIDNINNIEKINLSLVKYLILSFDDNKIEEVQKKISAKILTVGFQWGADFQASDLKQQDGYTNFKINHQGKIVPIWLKGYLNQEEMFAVLSAIAIGTIFELNLVEISQIFLNGNISKANAAGPHRLEA